MKSAGLKHILLTLTLTLIITLIIILTLILTLTQPNRNPNPNPLKRIRRYFISQIQPDAKIQDCQIKFISEKSVCVNIDVTHRKTQNGGGLQ